MSLFNLDPALDQPLYRQIALQVKSAVEDGSLHPGDKLPTVRELSQELATASGTVKRAYDELARQGVIEMTQGKGTFIAQPATENSRKEQAMAAIDGMLDCLQSLSFTQQEIQIFLDLKLRERLLRETGLRIAVVARSPECLRAVTERLYGLPEVTLYPVSLAEVEADPVQITADMDLVVATDRCYHALSTLLNRRIPLVRMCLRLSAASVSQMARLPDGVRIGLLTQSMLFATTVRRACGVFCCGAVLQETRVLGGADRMELSYCDAVMVPAGYEVAGTPEELAQLAEYSSSHPLIRLELEPDQASVRNLEEALDRRRKNYANRIR